MSSNNFDLAMGEAKRYAAKRAIGDVVLAREIRRTIDDLVAYRHEGRWVLPTPVAQAMGRPELGVRS
jgi:hypothetical protein